MKKLTVCLWSGLLLLAGNLCAQSQYEGTYSGTYSGGESGTWQVDVDSAGNVTGYIKDPWGESYYGTGKVQANGVAGIVLYVGATFSGQINAAGYFTGTWENPGYELTGTFTGRRKSVQLTVVNGSGGGLYVSGTKVTIRATVPAGMKFSEWNDGNTNSTYIITMPATPVTYTATFTDSQKPTVVITAPSASQRIVTNGPFTARGSAADNKAVALVKVQLNNGSWTDIITTNSWNLPMTLVPGSNTVRACSMDMTGNISATSSVFCTYVVLGNLTVTTNGVGTVTRTPATPPEVGAKYTLTAAPGTGFAFTNWTGDVTSTNKILSFTMASNMMLRANFIDTQKPTVAITAPTAAQRVLGTNEQFIVKGTAADNGIVTGVFCRVNSGAWMNASTTNGWKNWSLLVPLTAGSNLVQACSADSAGNISATSGVSCTYVVLGNLTVLTNGVGTITRAPATPPEVGAKYALTAAPGAGFVFINWSGDLTSTNKVLSFTMTNTLTITANFADIQKPTVAISAPAALQRILGTNGSFTVKGTATDNSTLSNVMVKVNSDSPVPACTTTNGWKNWSLPVMLTPGTNTIEAYSVDITGNCSLTVTTKCVYVETGTLIINTNGPGTVAIAPAGALELGKSYTLTATAGTGGAFSNWTGDAVSNPTGKVVVVSLTVSNRTKTVTANFTDTAKPTVAITLPTALLKVSNEVYTVRGTATDNGVLAGVFCCVNSGEWTNAVTTNAWKSWSVPVTLVRGTNTIQAYSVDTANNCSSTASVKCIYLETVTLADYNPLPLGAIWVYDGTDWEGAPSKTSNRVASVNFVITNFTGGVAARSYTTNCVRMSAANLYSTGEVYPWDEYWGGDGRYGSFGDDDLPSESIRIDGGLFIPAQMTVGTSVSGAANSYDKGVFQGLASWKVQIIEKTSLAVPAGYFPNVLHMRITMGTQVFDHWIAKSVGMIKRQGISGPGAAEKYELIQYFLPPPLSIAAQPSALDISSGQGAAPALTSHVAITVDGATNDWTNVPRTSFSYASVTQEVAAALNGNNVALLLSGCPFSTSDTALVYFKLRLTYSSGEARHSVDLWTSGSALYGMIDGQLITGFEAVLLNGVLEVKFPVEQSPSQITIEEIGCGMDTGGGALTELFRFVQAQPLSW